MEVTKASPSKTAKDRDFLNHLETYLAKRDGVDKLLKISRYASKIILASSILPETLILTHRLKSFESSVGVSRKAFRLGKFVQDINSLSNSRFNSGSDLALSIVVYGGEGFYYFVEQFVWLAKSGLIDKKHLSNLQKISAWAEFIGYLGSLTMKIRDLKVIHEDEACLKSSIEIAILRGGQCTEEEERLKKLEEKKLMKKFSVVQDLADGLMAVADIRDGKGRLSAPFLVSCAGLLSAMDCVLEIGYCGRKEEREKNEEEEDEFMDLVFFGVQQPVFEDVQWSSTDLCSKMFNGVQQPCNRRW